MPDQVVNGLLLPDYYGDVRQATLQGQYDAGNNAARAYALNGDYLGAQRAAVMGGNYDAAKNYGGLDTSQGDIQLATALANNDPKTAKQVAARHGNVNALSQIPAFQLQQAQQQIMQHLGAIQSVDSLPMEQRPAAYQQAIKNIHDAVVAEGSDPSFLSSLPSVYTPTAVPTAMQFGLSMLDRINLGLKSTEVGANATEAQARARLYGAEADMYGGAGGGGANGPPPSPDDLARRQAIIDRAAIDPAFRAKAAALGWPVE